MAKDKSSGGSDLWLYVGLGVGALVLAVGGYFAYKHFFGSSMPAPAASSGDGSQDGSGNGGGGYDQSQSGLDGQYGGPIDPSILAGANLQPIPGAPPISGSNLLSGSNIAPNPYGTTPAGTNTGTPPAVPSGLNATNITATGATLGWAAVPGVATYLVQWRPVGTQQWQSASVSGVYTGYNAFGVMQAGTPYEFQVAAQDQYGNTSAYTGSTNFTTSGSASGGGGAPQATNTGNTDVWGNGTVALWADCNYGGAVQSLGVGSYDLPALQSAGYRNDTLSSINIPAGRTVTIYQDAGFKGASVTFQNDVECLTSIGMKGKKSWNDQMSSIRIS